MLKNSVWIYSCSGCNKGFLGSLCVFCSEVVSLHSNISQFSSFLDYLFVFMCQPFRKIFAVLMTKLGGNSDNVLCDLTTIIILQNLGVLNSLCNFFSCDTRQRVEMTHFMTSWSRWLYKVNTSFHWSQVINGLLSKWPTNTLSKSPKRCVLLRYRQQGGGSSMSRG